jgi:flagellar hook assembly protein FlgD
MEQTIEELNASLKTEVAALTQRSTVAETALVTKDAEVAAAKVSIAELTAALAKHETEKAELALALKAEQDKQTTVAAKAAQIAASAGIAPLAVTNSGNPVAKSRNEIVAEFVKLKRDGSAKEVQAFYEANRASILGR